jgi:hypothetical protein
MEEDGKRGGRGGNLGMVILNIYTMNAKFNARLAGNFNISANRLISEAGGRGCRRKNIGK